MHTFTPTTQTTVFIGLFVAVYLTLLVRRVVLNKVDLYDFFMLSTVALVPAFFVVFPKTVSWLARVLGVEFPFLLLFGALNLITFLLLYRIIRRTNKMKADLVRVIQEVGIISAQHRQVSADSLRELERKIEGVGFR